jgi:hypothetical protein
MAEKGWRKRGVPRVTSRGSLYNVRGRMSSPNLHKARQILPLDTVLRKFCFFLAVI